MPCVWGRHNNSQIFLPVGIVDATKDLATTDPTSGGVRPVPATLFTALLDTGAQKTMISTKVVSTVGLDPIGKIPLQGIGPNITYHDGYLFHVAFTFPLPAGLAARTGGSPQTHTFIYAVPIYGAELGLTDSSFDVLLGMDIIGTGSLKVDGDGTFSFSF
jgi:hypothetical protein